MNSAHWKFAELGGFKTSASANASFLVVKKKLLAGAGVNGEGSLSSTPKKAKGKALADADVNDDNDDVIGDDEKTPNAGSPKKKGGRKAKAAAPEDDEANATSEKAVAITVSPKKKGGRKAKATATEGNEISTTSENVDAVGEEVATPSKAKRGRKPKDPNAPPAKRGKKNAVPTASEATTEMNDPNDQLTTEGNAHNSIFGDGVKAMNEDDRVLDDEEQKIVDQGLSGKHWTAINE